MSFNKNGVKAKCEECGKRTNVQSSYRLDARNWHKQVRRLCTPCRSKLGFALAYQRTSKLNY